MSASLNKKYHDAFLANRRASDRRDIARRRVDNFIAALFIAMKDWEKTEFEAAKALYNLQKIEKALHHVRR